MNSFRFIKIGMIDFCKTKGAFWLRIFGYGISIKNIKKSPLLFSERYGYRGKTIHNFHFTFLKPIREMRK